MTHDRGLQALAEIEAHLVFKVATFDPLPLRMPPKSFGRFRPMGIAEARAVCASYNAHLRRWRDTADSHWPLAKRMGGGGKSTLCFKLRTGTRRTCWMSDGGGVIKFRGRFESYYHADFDILADRFLANADLIKWAGWYAPKGRGQ